MYVKKGKTEVCSFFKSSNKKTISISDNHHQSTTYELRKSVFCLIGKKNIYTCGRHQVFLEFNFWVNRVHSTLMYWWSCPHRLLSICLYILYEGCFYTVFVLLFFYDLFLFILYQPSFSFYFALTVDNNLLHICVNSVSWWNLDVLFVRTKFILFHNPRM